jgi:hypothetical protein
MDGRKNNGGHSTKGFAGRKPKAEEQALIERLSPFEDVAVKKLEMAVRNGENWAIKLYFEYRYGKPRQTIEQNSTHTFTDFDIKEIVNFD